MHGLAWFQGLLHWFCLIYIVRVVLRDIRFVNLIRVVLRNIRSVNLMFCLENVVINLEPFICPHKLRL